jgi:hypothetical protein
MPIVPEVYDRGPLTEEERWALSQSRSRGSYWGGSWASRKAREILERFRKPVIDVFRLRHPGKFSRLHDAHLLLQRAMDQLHRSFWDWSLTEWFDFLCPSIFDFRDKYGVRFGWVRPTLLDVAYLLGRISDLRPLGISQDAAAAANIYFGFELMSQQCQCMMEALQGVGYGYGKDNLQRIRHALSLLFMLKRSPYWGDISESLLADLETENREIYHASSQIALGLQQGRSHSSYTSGICLATSSDRAMVVPTRSAGVYT